MWLEKSLLDAENVGGEEGEMRHIVATPWGPTLSAERQN